MGHGKDVQDGLREPYRAFRNQLPEVFAAYRELGRSIFAAGALDVKTKELIALALSVSRQCDGCIASHAKGAARAGATAEEVGEALAVVIALDGGPATVYGPRAFDAFLEFSDPRDQDA